MVIRDVREELARTFLGVIPELSPVFIADSILSRSFYLSADLRGWADVPTVRSGEQSALGAADLLALNAIDPDGAGCWFGSFRAERAPLSDAAHVVLARIARHLAFAHRLRRRFGDTGISAQSADAVLEPGGRIQQARGPAKGRHTRELLASAAVSIDRTRSRRGQGDSLRAIQGWPELVSMRWTLVDHFERDGRRYVLAIDNRPKSPSFELLSAREREVVRQALLGRHNKAIAYDLALAQSTVRVLMARAAAKVGARSRSELLTKAANAGANIVRTEKTSG